MGFDELKVLITGGAGYIGSHIVRDVCDSEHDVIVLDNLSLGLRENVDKRATFVEGDILNAEHLAKVFESGIDVVFHFAAWKAAGESMADPAKYAHNNICGTISLLNAMLEYGTKNIIFSSSAAVYGEPEYNPIDENHPLEPTNYYGLTKKIIEENLEWYSRLKGLRYASLRYFNATGYDIKGKITGREKNPVNLSPIVMETCAGIRPKITVFGNDYNTPDGTCVRDYIHVNDLSDAHIRGMEYLLNTSQNLVVNLGTGRGYSVLEMIEAAQKVTGRSVHHEIGPRREGDPAELVASSDRAYTELGWKARYSDLDTIFKTMSSVYL